MCINERENFLYNIMNFLHRHTKMQNRRKETCSMSKKSNKKLYMMLVNELIGQNSNNLHTRTDTLPKDTPPKDYLLDAEKASVQAEQEKNSHERQEILKLMYQMDIRQQKDHATILQLQKRLRSSQKENKAIHKILNNCTEKIMLLSKKIEKLQKQAKKEQAVIKELSDTLTKMKHIIACISFMKGVSSISDSLGNITRKWDKTTKRKNKHLDGPVIDVDYKSS